MNFKLTIGLIVALALVCALYFALPNKTAETKNDQSATAVFATKPTGVKVITFSRDGENQVAFARGQKGWEMTYPVAAPAESYLVDSISDSLVGLSYKEKFDVAPSGNHSAQATGTGKPRYLIGFTDDAGKEHNLALGKTTVGGVYATLDGAKTVYLLEGNPAEALDKPAESFRDHNIKTIKTDRIAQLTIAHGDQKVVLTKTGEKWLITKPVNARADAAKVNEILDQLKSITAAAFTDMSKTSAATGLNPPVASVTAIVQGFTPPATAPATGPATAPAGETVTLQLGYYTGLMDKKDVYASLAGSKEVFTFDAKSFDKLNRELQDLRDPAITPAMVGDATEASITTDGKLVAKVEKKDGSWNLLSTATPVKAGDKEVGDWLGDIRNLRAIKYVDDAGNLKAIGLDPPTTRIELTVPGQSQHEVILIGKPETADKVTPMMRQGEATVYLVQSADAAGVLKTNLDLRDKTIERLSSSNIRGITISGLGAAGGETDLVREGTSWRVKTGAKSVKADDEKITGLLADFTPLMAEKYDSEKADGAGKADVVVTLDVVEPVVKVSTHPAATGPASTLPAGLMGKAAGPEEGKTVKRVLKLFKSEKGKATTWRAVWDGAAPQWSFEPTGELVEHLTKESYAASPATQPPATKPAEKMTK